MSIILPRSVFFHIGRTGGHWVNKVLWKNGLIVERLHPLHVTPVQAGSSHLVMDRSFAFCFVRHPLEWAGSFWRHEMEFGWSDSTFGKAVASDNFSLFVKRLLEAFPEGPCGLAMAPYVDHCHYVGSLENLRRDLGLALKRGGETFDEQSLQEPPVNQSEIRSLKQACKAPRNLLKKLLSADRVFCERFGYQGVPSSLIGSVEGSAWPKLSLAQPTAGTASRPVDPLHLSKTRFTYHLEDGRAVGGTGHEQRLQWGLLATLEALEGSKRCVVVSETDPYLAYLIAEHVGAQVTFAPADLKAVPQRLTRVLKAKVETIDYRALLGGSERFDAVVLVDSAEINPLIEVELLRIGHLLEPGGKLLMVVPALQTDLPIRTDLPLDMGVERSRKIAYRSFAQVQIMLENHGFQQVTKLDMFNEVAATGKARSYLDPVAEALQIDPGHFLGKMLVSATRATTQDQDRQDERLRALWLGRWITDLNGPPYDSLPALVEGRLLMLEAEARSERARRDDAEQGLADRERDLIVTRQALQANKIDADYSRSLIDGARRDREAAQQELDELRQMMRDLSLDGLLSRDLP